MSAVVKDKKEKKPKVPMPIGVRKFRRVLLGLIIFLVVLGITLAALNSQGILITI